MARIFKRRGMGIMASVLSFGALGMIVMALVTNNWVTADLLRTSSATGNGSETRHDGGTKSFGLFSGSVSVNFGLGGRDRDFKVKDEFEGVANDKVVWATLGFCVLSTPFICLGIGMACYNEFSKTNLIICGTIGIFIAHGIALLLILTAVCLYAALFEIQLKKNVLRPTDIQNGFESTDRARLDFSFWVLLGSAGVVLLSPFLLLLSKIHLTHYFKTSPNIKETAATTDGVMLY